MKKRYLKIVKVPSTNVYVEVTDGSSDIYQIVLTFSDGYEHVFYSAFYDEADCKRYCYRLFAETNDCISYAYSFISHIDVHNLDCDL